MRIGICPPGNPNAGGIYQYGLTMLETLYQHKGEGADDDFIVFASGKPPFDLMSLNGKDWSAALAEPSPPRQGLLDALRRKLNTGPQRKVWIRLRKAIRVRGPHGRQHDRELHRAREQFGAEGVELLLFPSSLALAFEAGFPYVMAIHDLQHRLQPEFPEVSANGEWERREYVFRNGASQATLILADSEVGKEDILNCYGQYGVQPDQVKVLPFLPSGCIRPEIPDEERLRVRALHRLPERYLFYPAQFWPHKNHKRIIQAMGLLKKEHGIEIKAVFCGSHADQIRQHTFNDVMTVATRLGIEKNIRYLGYVADEDISAIYAESVALVMPTFFGPTNIPVLEAWALGCPVLTSDIRGIREQVADAGILVDPRSVESLADGIYRLWTDSVLCQILIDRGRWRLAKYTPADYRQRLTNILEEGKLRVSLSNGKVTV